MDIEEQNEIAHHRRHGLPETTKGPYYHKTWWESYKGAVKGMLGGIMVGGLVGALTGGAVIGVIAIATTLSGAGGLAGLATTIGTSAVPLVGSILAATTLFGMYEGKVKFEKVGTVTGAIAAAEETSEVRMKEYMREKVTGLTNEIRELKAAVAGKIDVKQMHIDAALPDKAPIFDESDFRATHQSSDDPSDDHKLFYPKVGLIGALVGAAMATIAVTSGFAPHFAAEALSMGAETALAAQGSIATATIATGAALGASFGVSRDIFRKIFDVTDCWFMGVTDGACTNAEIAHAKGKEFEPLAPPHAADPAYSQVPIALDTHNTPSPEITNVFIAEPQKTTYLQDKPSPEVAKMAILGMDHTNSRMH